MRPLSPILALAAAVPAACAHADLAALEPLCGSWSSEGDVHVREDWRRAGDHLEGTNTSIAPDGRIVGSETMTLRLGPRGTVYRAEPAGAAATEFTEVRDPALAPAAGERLWIWENRAHDFPRRIVYRLAGERLFATISDPDGDAERRRGVTWEFRRIAACPAR